MDDARTLLVGVGSPFGDDRVGAIVVRRAAEQLARRTCVLGVPLDLLDHLPDDAAELERLHVVDACRGAGPAGTIVRYEWPIDATAEFRAGGSHDFHLPAVLRLAEQLRRLPRQTTLWGIEAGDDGDLRIDGALSPAVAAAADELVRRLVAECRPTAANVAEHADHA